jgi:hypothetical protein
MKKLLFLILTIALAVPVRAQDEAAAEKTSDPVRFTFDAGILIENQTIETPYKGGLVLEIHHRFSLIENYHNIFGIYGSANTRMGLNYGITDRIMVGIGTTKDYKLQDLQWKYQILKQTEDNSVPVSLAYYGNFVADLRKDDAFGPEDRYKHIHRLSYFTQLIVARKLNERFSVQLAPSAIYFNAVPEYSDTQGYKNFNLGLSAGVKANIAGAHNLVLEYDQLLTKQDLDEQPKPNLALGWERSTATHTFHLFVTNFSQVINQRNLLFNTNDFTKGDYLFGFNITVRF